MKLRIVTIVFILSVILAVWLFVLPRNGGLSSYMKTDIQYGNTVATNEHVNNQGRVPSSAEQLPSDIIQSSLHILTNRNEKTQRRMEAADALGTSRSEKAVFPLLDVYMNDSEEIWLRYKVARALGKIRDERAVQPLSTIMLSLVEDRHLRVVSSLALGNIGSIACVDALHELYSNSDESLRYKALQGLEKTGNPIAYPMVLAAIDDEDRTVKARAIHATGALGDDDAVVVLSNYLKSSDDVFLQIACLTALEKQASDAAISVILQYTNHPNELLRINSNRIISGK